MVLALKVDKAEELKDCGPISLVGCLHKIITKILASKMKMAMLTLVGKSQSSFVWKRQILDGDLIANKAIWWVKKKRIKASLLKLDFHKAYDSVKWSFVDRILEVMRFGNKWKRMIRYCITLASLSIFINVSPTASSKMEKGLRQGDPLSPFLFILVAKVMNRMIIKARELGVIKGAEVGKEKIELTHLQFVDNILLICLAKKEVILDYRRLLDCVTLLSGLTINYSKLASIPLCCEDEWGLEIGNLLKSRV